MTRSSDTVDRRMLDCAVHRLGLPCWFWKTYVWFHAHVRLWFKLAAGLEEAWTRDGGHSTGVLPQHGVYLCN